MLGTIIGCNFCLMSLLKMLCLLFCLRVGVDPEEEDRKSAYVSVSIVGFVIRNMEGIFFSRKFLCIPKSHFGAKSSPLRKFLLVPLIIWQLTEDTTLHAIFDIKENLYWVPHQMTHHELKWHFHNNNKLL